MRKRLQQLAKLSLSEWAIFSQLLLFSLIVEIGFKWLTMLHLVSLTNWCAENRLLKYLPLLSRRCEKDRLLGLVHLAARVVGGTGSCLPRSLLVFWLLKSRREPVELLIGVNTESTNFQAHAWVEARGVAINEDPEQVRCFIPLFHF